MTNVYIQAMLKGLDLMLRERANGRNVHLIKNVQASINNWEHLIRVRNDFTPTEKSKLDAAIRRAKKVIRDNPPL